MDANARKQMKALEKTRTRKHVSESEYTTAMEDPDNILEIDGLKTSFFTDSGVVTAVDGISLNIPSGKTVALVGESGCGKSVTSLSAMQLLPRPQGQITGGAIRLNMGSCAYDIAKMPERAMMPLRGDRICMIFQEPMTALNPVFPIGRQITEVIARHDSSRKDSASQKARCLELLEMVGIPNPAGIYQVYPHNLSGGMRQRIMIAMSLACNPRLIIADEPTTALDVTIQAQILSLLKDLKNRLGSAILLITHDLGVVAGMADYVAVMYAGRIVEQGTVREIFRCPAHPYTIGLMASRPVIGNKQDRLFAINGKVPDPLSLPKHCYFWERCDHRTDHCQGEYPCQIQLSKTHTVSCYRSGEVHHEPE